MTQINFADLKTEDYDRVVGVKFKNGQTLEVISPSFKISYSGYNFIEPYCASDYKYEEIECSGDSEEIEFVTLEVRRPSLDVSLISETVKP